MQCSADNCYFVSFSHYFPQHPVHHHKTEVKLRILNCYPSVMRWPTVGQNIMYRMIASIHKNASALNSFVKLILVVCSCFQTY